MPASVAMSRDGVARDLAGPVGVLVDGHGLGAGDRARAGADERQQPALHGALVQLDVVADLEAAHEVEERLQRRAVGVEQQRRLGSSAPSSSTSSTRRSPSILPLCVRKAA